MECRTQRCERVTFRVSVPERRLLDRAAARADVTVSEIVRAELSNADILPLASRSTPSAATDDALTTSENALHGLGSLVSEV